MHQTFKKYYMFECCSISYLGESPTFLPRLIFSSSSSSSHECAVVRGGWFLHVGREGKGGRNIPLSFSFFFLSQRRRGGRRRRREFTWDEPLLLHVVGMPLSGGFDKRSPKKVRKIIANKDATTANKTGKCWRKILGDFQTVFQEGANGK